MSADKVQSGSGGIHAVRNVLANWGAFVFSAVIGFVLSPYVVHHLGNTQYGIWVLLGSLVGYLGFLDLGVRGAVMRFVANLHAGENHDEAGRMASAGLALFSLLGLLALTIAVVLALAARHLFTIPEAMLGAARIVLILGGFNIAIALVSGVFGGIITARQRFDISSSVQMIIEVTRALGVLLALHLGYGLVALAVVQLTISIARGGIDFVVSRRLYPELRIGLRSWSRQHVRQLLGYSMYAALLHLSALVILQMDAIVIGAFLPVAMITFFAIAGNLTQSGRALVAGISQTVAPRVSALQGRGNVQDAGRVVVTSGRLATLVLLPIVLTFILRGSAFIGIWMGQSYAELSGKVLIVLSLLLGVTAGRQVIGSALLGLNQHKALVPVFILEAILNVGLSVALVGRYGLVGVAWGTAGPGLVSSLFLVPRVLCKAQHLRLRDVWWEIWLRPILAMIPFGLALYAAAQVWNPSSILGFFAQTALVLPVAALGAWAVGLDVSERSALTDRLLSLVRPPARRAPSSA
jgi:O-antigen/teichoic acid export membrane protein